MGCLSRFENCRNSRGWGGGRWGGGETSTCGMEIPGVWGSKAKVPSLGVIDIFWNYTICPFSTTCNPDYHNSLKSWWGWSIIYVQYMYKFFFEWFFYFDRKFLVPCIEKQLLGQHLCSILQKGLFVYSSIHHCMSGISLSTYSHLSPFSLLLPYDITVWPLIYKKRCNPNNHVKVKVFLKYTKKGFKEKQTFHGCSLFYHSFASKATQ